MSNQVSVLPRPRAADGLNLSALDCVIAGYAGRHIADVERHIAELAAVGVAPPPEVPMFYRVATSSLTTSEVVPVDSSHTSGEVEPVIVVTGGRSYLGIGSDHTDRAIETRDVLASKAACAKPLASTLVEVTDWSELDWDAIRIRSWVDGELYQDGHLAELRPPTDLLAIMADRGLRTDALVCFGGTLPLLEGAFVHGTFWQLRMDIPGGPVVAHSYHTKEVRL